MHYYQFHIGDYKSHTHHLSLIEDLAYRRLLDHYYLHQSPIKPKDIARQIGMRDYEQDVLAVLEEFFVSTEDGYKNPRADKEIKAFVEHQAVSAYGAFCRTNKDLVSIVDKTVFVDMFIQGKHGEYINSIRAHHVPIMCTSSTHDATINHKPITNNHKPLLEENTYVQEDVKNSTNKIANCEYQKVIDVYHECLPELSKARLLTKARERLIKQRWNWILTSKKPDGERRATNAQEALVWFENYFNRVRDNDFLMGRVKQSNDHKNWKCDIDFLMEDRGLKHVIEKTEG